MGHAQRRHSGTSPVLMRSKTVQTFRKLVDSNEIKGRLDKKVEKTINNYYAPGIEPAILLPIWIKDGACAAQALGTSLCARAVKKHYRHLGNLWIAMKVKGRLIKRKKKDNKQFYAPGMEPATSKNMDKRWGIRSAGTLGPHLYYSGQKAIQTFRKLVDFNEIKERLIKY